MERHLGSKKESATIFDSGERPVAGTSQTSNFFVRERRELQGRNDCNVYAVIFYSPTTFFLSAVSVDLKIEVAAVAKHSDPTFLQPQVQPRIWMGPTKIKHGFRITKHYISAASFNLGCSRITKRHLNLLLTGTETGQETEPRFIIRAKD